MEKVEKGEEVFADSDQVNPALTDSDRFVKSLQNASLSDGLERNDLEVILKVEEELDLVTRSTTETITKLSRLLGHCSATTVGTCQLLEYTLAYM